MSPVGLRVISCGVWQRPAAREERNRGWTPDCFGLLMVERDGGYVETARHERQELVPGSRFALFPGVRHQYGPQVGQDWIEWHLFCEGPFLDRLVGEGHLDPAKPVLGHDDGPLWCERWRALLDHAKRGDEHGVIATAVDLWLRAAWRPQGNQPDNEMDLLAIAIRREPCAQLVLAREAKRFGLSVSGLRQAFKRRHGVPIYHFQQRHRIDLATRLIAEGVPAKDVGVQVGYPDPTHFSRVFRRVTGQSIRTFQRSIAFVAKGIVR